MTLEETLKINCELRDKIYQLYQELNENEKVLVNLFRENKLNYTYTEKDKITLKYYQERIVDYKVMQEKYPQFYRDGLIEVFSMSEANKLNDAKLNGLVLQDCMIHNPIYKLKYERNKGFNK